MKIVRHRDDLQVEHENLLSFWVTIGPVRSKSIQVGDIMPVQKDEIFPVDLILIATSNPDGSKFQLLLWRSLIDLKACLRPRLVLTKLSMD
jgi:hypothetical protein